MRYRFLTATCLLVVTTLSTGVPAGDEESPPAGVVARPGRFEALTEPPCSYCSTEHRKGLIRNGERVVAWLRGAHNGGAAPLRHFLAGPRVVNDTYGLFFYDPDGGYVAAYEKDYGYSFYGWRRGVMVVQDREGTLYSALTGRAFHGPGKGRRLKRIASIVTDWEHWLMLHPESTAYNLFDGKRYAVAELPGKMSREALRSMSAPDKRLPPRTMVLGVEIAGKTKAYPLAEAGERACIRDEIDGEPVTVFWYGPTSTAVAFSPRVDGRVLTFYADDVSPETAPFKDRQSGTRWTLAGRAVDGPLRGRELQWLESIQCRWYAWSAENPQTLVYEPKMAEDNDE